MDSHWSGYASCLIKYSTGPEVVSFCRNETLSAFVILSSRHGIRTAWQILMQAQLVHSEHWESSSSAIRNLAINWTQMLHCRIARVASCVCTVAGRPLERSNRSVRDLICCEIPAPATAFSPASCQTEPASGTSSKCVCCTCA